MMLQKENIKEHNPNWTKIPDHPYPYRISITGGSISAKINSLFNLINQQPDIDKIYIYIFIYTYMYIYIYIYIYKLLSK